jgi:hypothetical protein
LEQLGSLAEDLSFEAGARVASEEGVADAVEGSAVLKDALSYQSDVSMGGVFDPGGMAAGAATQANPADLPYGGTRFRDSSGNSWPTPFSEN